MNDALSLIVRFPVVAMQTRNNLPEAQLSAAQCRKSGVNRSNRVHLSSLYLSF